MKDYQKETLHTYENNLGLYLDRTPQEVSGGFKEFIDLYTSRLPENAQVLEIGSGTGRDATYIQSQCSANIRRTDVVQSFISYQKDTFDTEVEYLDALNIDDIEAYDSVLALAVLLHFNKEDCEAVCKKIYTALKPGGTLAFSIKNKLTEKDEEVTSQKMEGPRYFYYWTLDDFVEMLEIIGFTCDNVIMAEGDKWIQGIAWKKK